jgi:hypothetical protein
MPGLVPGIHVLADAPRRNTWMAGTSPAMTENAEIFGDTKDAESADAFPVRLSG